MLVVACAYSKFIAGRPPLNMYSIGFRELSCPFVVFHPLIGPIYLIVHGLRVGELIDSFEDELSTDVKPCKECGIDYRREWRAYDGWIETKIVGRPDQPAGLIHCRILGRIEREREKRTAKKAVHRIGRKQMEGKDSEVKVREEISSA